MNIYQMAKQKLKNFFGLGLPSPPKLPHFDPIPPAATREDRKRARRQHWNRRNLMVHRRQGGPKLTGKRAERIDYACSLEHLTVPPRSRTLDWLILDEKGITPQRRIQK